MLVYFEDHDYHFECENLCRMFYPYSKVTRAQKPEQLEQEDLSLYAAVKALPVTSLVANELANIR